MTALRDASGLYAAAVALTLDALTLTEADTAAVKLAKGYAVALDNDADLKDYGPRLLACLESLGATPAARQRVKNAIPGTGTGSGRLADIRAASG